MSRIEGLPKSTSDIVLAGNQLNQWTENTKRTCIFIPDKSAKAVSFCNFAFNLSRASIKLVNSFLSSFERPQGKEGDGFRCPKGIKLFIQHPPKHPIGCNPLSYISFLLDLKWFSIFLSQNSDWHLQWLCALCLSAWPGRVLCKWSTKRLAEKTHSVAMWEKNGTLQITKKMSSTLLHHYFLGFHSFIHIETGKLPQQSIFTPLMSLVNEPRPTPVAFSPSLIGLKFHGFSVGFS